MKKNALLLSLLLFFGYALDGYSQEVTEHNSLWLQGSFYKSWERIKWSGNRMGGGSANQTKNLMGVDIQLGFNVVSGWGFWVRATGFGGKHTEYPFIKDDFDFDRVSLSDGRWLKKGESGRTVLSLGGSYAHRLGARFGMIAKFGFGGSLGNVSVWRATLTDTHTNEEYTLDIEQTRRAPLLDMGVDFSYRVFKEIYLSVGVRYLQGLGKYKQRRSIYDADTSEVFDYQVYKSKPFMQLGLNTGVGIRF